LPACFHVLSPKVLKGIGFNQFQSSALEFVGIFYFDFYVSDTGCPDENLTRPYYMQ
jgi:hypothetical protein